MAVMAIKRYMPEEYLAIERAAETKSEYYRGEMFAMSGTSRRHKTIVSNCVRAVKPRMIGTSLELYGSGMLVAIPKERAYCYPDVVFISGRPQFTDEHTDCLLNPTMLIEVLAPETELCDLGVKPYLYQEIESVQAFVMIGYREPFAWNWICQSDNTWLLYDLRHLNDVLRLDAIGCAVPLSDIYRGVSFEDAAADEAEPS